MANIPQPSATLTAIQQKVRLLTRSPSINQLSDAQLNSYINTFIVYDFPEHLRTFVLRRPFTFWVNANQDTYPTDQSYTNLNNPLYNFQNNVLAVHSPFYVAGYPALFTQSRTQFYGIYPQVNQIVQVATGDGIAETFTGSIANVGGNLNPSIGGNIPFLPSVTTIVANQILVENANVTFTAHSITTSTMNLVDLPLVNGDNYSPQGVLANANNATAPIGGTFVNYLTGQFQITFPFAPAAGSPINVDILPYVPARPQAILYYNNVFTVRPVPDQGYAVNFEVDLVPTQLLEAGDEPILREWWQYIAYGAAKKVFEDRMDLDSVAQILPEYRKQENLCNRRTIVQNTNERVATIYTEQTGFGSVSGFGWGGW